MHKEECVKKDFCGAGMPFEENKKLKFIQHLKSIKAPSLIYADLESSIKEIRGCKNNWEKPSAVKVAEHISCSYTMSTIWTFDDIENKHDV